MIQLPKAQCRDNVIKHVFFIPLEMHRNLVQL